MTAQAGWDLVTSPGWKAHLHYRKWKATPQEPPAELEEAGLSSPAVGTPLRTGKKEAGDGVTSSHVVSDSTRI